MPAMLTERTARQVLIAIAPTALAFGLVAWSAEKGDLPRWIWTAGTLPVLVGLLASMIRDFLAGRIGVDAIAFVSMSAAIALGEALAGVVVAVIYAGENVLEDIAVSRSERDRPCSEARASPWKLERGYFHRAGCRR